MRRAVAAGCHDRRTRRGDGCGNRRGGHDLWTHAGHGHAHAFAIVLIFDFGQAGFVEQVGEFADEVGINVEVVAHSLQVHARRERGNCQHVAVGTKAAHDTGRGRADIGFMPKLLAREDVR